MKNEDKVITREQAQKFQRLGIAIETEKYWVKFKNKDSAALLSVADYGEALYDYQVHASEPFVFEGWPAPDVAELGEILHKFGYEVCLIQGLQRLWSLHKISMNHSIQFYQAHEHPEAQARGAAVIWLRENGHLEEEEDGDNS